MTRVRLDTLLSQRGVFPSRTRAAASVLAGGFGSAVWETLSDAGLAPRILRVGLPDRYVTHGAPNLLHEEVGFTGERIAERIEAAVAEPERVAG